MYPVNACIHILHEFGQDFCLPVCEWICMCSPQKCTCIAHFGWILVSQCLSPWAVLEKTQFTRLFHKVAVLVSNTRTILTHYYFSVLLNHCFSPFLLLVTVTVTVTLTLSVTSISDIFCDRDCYCWFYFQFFSHTKSWYSQSGWYYPGTVTDTHTETVYTHGDRNT